MLRDISEFDRDDFEDWGLVPITADAGSFLSTLAADVIPFLNAPVITSTGITLTQSDERTRVLQQYDWLDLNQQAHLPSSHDLYAGYDPLWSDIILNRDAEFEIVDRAIKLILNDEKQQSIYCLWGDAFTGKSTALLRIARRLISLGYDVFSFRGDFKLDIGATTWWLRRSPKTVILIDGLADPAPEVGRLAEICEQSSIPLVLIGAERASRMTRLYSAIAARFLNASSDLKMHSLSDADADRLLNKLTAARRLGKITSLPYAQQRQYFIGIGKRDLFTALTDLEGGRGFLKRLREDYEDIKRQDFQDAYIICSISYSLGYSLPISILCAAADVSLDNLLLGLSTDGELADILERHHNRVKPRNRRLASVLIERVVEKEKLYDLTIALARKLAPYVTRETIRQRIVPYRIARELLDAKIISDWVGLDRVNSWYDKLMPDYDWNARFWEQRALAEAIDLRFDTAESYAERAVQLHADPFSLNTLGAILMRKAVDWYAPGETEARDYYWRGVRALVDSRRKAEDQYEHPYITFFRYTLRFVDKHYPNTMPDERIRHEWHSWWQSARHAPPFAHRSLADALGELHSEWLMHAVRQVPLQDS